MKVGDTVRRFDVMGDSKEFTIAAAESLAEHKQSHKAGNEYEVLKDGTWEPVPRLTVHQKDIPDACVNCQG